MCGSSRKNKGIGTRARVSAVVRTAPRSPRRPPWRIIRIPESLCPLLHILSIADTLDLFSIEAYGAQARGGFALQLVVILVRAVGPVVGTHVVPQVLHRIQLR